MKIPPPRVGWNLSLSLSLASSSSSLLSSSGEEDFATVPRSMTTKRTTTRRLAASWRTIDPRGPTLCWTVTAPPKRNVFRFPRRISFNARGRWREKRGGGWRCVGGWFLSELFVIAIRVGRREEEKYVLNFKRVQVPIYLWFRYCYC